MEYLAIGLLSIPVGILLLLLGAVLTPVQFDPPSWDEEVAWLLTCGLTQEEAEEIADLRWRI